MVVDETMVAFRGRIIFRQYNPGKAAKYGIKLYKLCAINGYTFAMSVYTGKSLSDDNVTMAPTTIGAAEKVCRDLGHDLYNEGRWLLVVDNFYTSYELARFCLDHQTHLVGTVRANKKKFPIEVLKAKLKRGQIVAKEDQHGIVLLTWRDARDVRMLSTMHAPELITKEEFDCAKSSDSIIDSNSTFENNNDENAENLLEPNTTDRRMKKKPRVIHYYNKGKCGIDLSDQMSSYATSLRKGVKWCRKLATEMLLGISIVNSWIVYKAATRRKIQIRKFRFETASYLLGISLSNHSIPVSVKQHFLAKHTERKNCSKCYQRLVNSLGRENARKKIQKTNFFCNNCPNHPSMCFACFNALHKTK